MVSRGLGRRRAVAGRHLTGVAIPDPVPPLTRRSWLGRLGERLHVRRPVAGDRPPPRRTFPVCAIGYALDGCRVVRVDGDGAAAGLRRHACPATRRSSTSSRSRDGPGAMAGADRRPRRARVRRTVDHVGAAGDRSGRSPTGCSGRPTTNGTPPQVTRARDRAARRPSTAAEAERRRIERDLHDGAQQRLVALAADLGAAREKLDARPRGGHGAGGRRPRGGQGGAHGDPRPRARHPPGDPRGPRARRRAVGRRRPIAGARWRSTCRSPSGRPRPSRAPPTSSSPRRSPTSPATPARPGPTCRSPGPATGSSSRSATTATAAPTLERDSGPARAARPGRRHRRHDVRDQPARAARPRSLVELPCGS